MATNIANKAKEVKAWIERQQPMAWEGKGSPGTSTLEIRAYIARRWPDLLPEIHAAIYAASI